MLSKFLLLSCVYKEKEKIKKPDGQNHVILTANNNIIVVILNRQQMGARSYSVIFLMKYSFP